MVANLNVGLDQGIGRNLRLKQRITHGKTCMKESELCTLVCWGYIEVTINRKWLAQGKVITTQCHRTGKDENPQ